MEKNSYINAGSSMKTNCILSALITLAVLTGSVPYGYAYCMMMERTVDSAMQMRCNSHRGTGQSSNAGMQSVESAKSMMRLVSKSTTDSYEHRSGPVNVQAFNILRLNDFPSIQPFGFGLSIRFEIEHPPPDLVIEILNLKI